MERLLIFKYNFNGFPSFAPTFGLKEVLCCVLCTLLRGRLQTTFFQSNVIVMYRGRAASHVTFCLPTKMSVLLGTVLQEKVTIL